MNPMEMRKKALKMMSKESPIVPKGKMAMGSEDPEMDLAMDAAEDGVEADMVSMMVSEEEKAMIEQMRKKQRPNPMEKMMAESPEEMA